jgi:hypothetical protein
MIKGATKDHFSLYSRNGLINKLLKENGKLVREAAVKLETNLNGMRQNFIFQTYLQLGLHMYQVA